jgi:hypothetical protein
MSEQQMRPAGSSQYRKPGLSCRIADELLREIALNGDCVVWRPGHNGLALTGFFGCH